MRLRRIRRSRAVPVIAALLVVVLAAPAVAGAQDPSDPTGVAAGSSTSRPSEQSADVLSADRDQVLGQVAALDSRIRAAESAAAEAQARVDAANAQAAAAQATADEAARSADEAAAQVRSYAVEAFVRPPAQDALSTMAIKESADASYATDVLQIVAERRGRVVDAMVAARTIAEKDREAAAQAADAAQSEVDRAEDQAASLRSARAEQSRLAASLDDRLDQKLAEAAALKEVDAAAAKELTAQEVSLRSSGPASSSPPTGTPVAAVSPSPGTTTPTPKPTTTQKPAATTTTTRPPTTPAPGLVTWADVTKAGGIWVHKSIAGQVSALVAAAKAAGINLSGGGYRDPAEQIALRKAHCGTSEYAIYQMPASQCTPPTAQPGKSMHERGLALDLQSNGRLITSRSDPAFQWLAANAARYGFYNLPSEPWHWSVNGS